MLELRGPGRVDKVGRGVESSDAGPPALLSVVVDRCVEK